ncbi:unnamed protein product [Rotaria sp. Silwood1]|nr:unnamed protein product [Rotaria sp. Silwood1]CAF0964887.1 unnamed protein product [Rotaria sp. Silwood1]CAF3381184.1 unnamed protein product [Rotaria sp. Silwood1]CAF4680357.1 unnamed protein product [Rotaria sp. Silwood1]
MNGDTDETNNSEHCSSTNNTTSLSSSVPQNQEKINLSSSFFNESIIVTQNNMNSTINNTTDENLLTISNNNEENPMNKSFKRKVVSFSAMPFEKKVADVYDCLRYMQEGSDFLKVRSYVRQFRRLYTLNDSLTAISWYPTSKKPSKAIITIDSIKEVRLGKTTERLREHAQQFENESMFSIIYTDGNNDYVSLDLVASSADEANIWVTGLSCLISGHGSPLTSSDLEDRQKMRDRWLRDVFAVGLSSTSECEPVNHNEYQPLCGKSSIDEEEAVRLLGDYGISEDKAKIRLQEIQSKKSDDVRGLFSTEDLVDVFKKLSTRPEIYHLLVRYSRNQDFLSTEDFTLFLEAEQGMSKVTREKCLEIIQKFEPSTEAKLLGHLGIDGFTNYLLSPECDIFNANHRSICHEMDHPLSHYFIASSHNTFLLADQLKGPSSVEGFIHALKRGCRCLELHCFDGPDDQPLIHNGTLTSRISLSEALQVISNYGFEKTNYPLILCMEIQCSISQQERIAQLLIEIFGEKLFLNHVSLPVDVNIASSKYRPLPSPNDLHGKIIIKSKKLPPGFSNDLNTDYGEIIDEEDCYEDNKRRSKKDLSNKKHRKLSRAFSDLVCVLRSAQFEDFNTAFNEQQSDQVCTFSENAALRLATSDAEEFINYNKLFISRVTPGTWRVDSSNLNPQDFWNVGCQMVSMNYQTSGKFMDVYFGRFLSNGGCGYVLKPSYLRSDNTSISATSSPIASSRLSSNVYSSNTPQILHIKIISALHLPRPEQAELKANSIDPYVVVQIFGVPRDTDEVRTKTIYHNSENPQFNEAFEFEIAFPELALVRFVVLDDDSLDYDFIGQYTLPFECIQTGYRHVHLHNIGGDLIANAYLFVHIVINSKSLAIKPRRSLSRYHRSLMRRKLRIASFRSVYNKQIDDLFKSVIQPLETAFEYRHAVEQSLYGLNEMCGLPEISNVKQCVRKIASRLQKANLTGAVAIRNQSDIPIFEYSTTLPELSRQSVVALEEVINQCRALIYNGTIIHKKLVNVQTEISELSKDIPRLLETSGVRGKKFTKAIDNFSYNLALLHGQTDLLNKAKQDANITIQQIFEAAETTNLLVESDQ